MSWYCFKKHRCDTCGCEFEYSQSSLTLVDGVKCPSCSTKYDVHSSHLSKSFLLDDEEPQIINISDIVR